MDPTQPDDVAPGNWIQTDPEKGWFIMLRLYSPLQPFFDNPALADPAYDMKDVVPIYLENLGMVGGPKGYLAGPGAAGALIGREVARSCGSDPAPPRAGPGEERSGR